jgi:hypothetical protein
MVWKSTTAGRSWSGPRYRARRTTACSLSAIAQVLRAWTEGFPNTPIYSPRKGAFEPANPIDGLELVTAVQLCLGRERQTCYGLLQWARMRARGESIRAFCVEGGPEAVDLLL